MLCVSGQDQFITGFGSIIFFFFFFSSRRRHTRSDRDWSSDVCSSDLAACGTGALKTDGRRLRMSSTVYVPRDAGALSLGAGEVAQAISREASARGLELRLVRNGSRGAYWLEPLVEVATAGGRLAYGPVTPADVPSLYAADFLNGGQHPLSLGPTDSIPWLASQQRPTFARVGGVDPTSLAGYVIPGGYQGLRARPS